MAMERLLMLELAAGGCAVEAQLNGMPVAALGPAGGSTSLAVHEYTLAGHNELSLVVGPGVAGATGPSQPRVAIGPTWARARLVLVAPGPVARRPGSARPRRRRVGDHRRPFLRRAVDAQARGRAAGQLPALALARRAADRDRRRGQARRSRVPAAARGRARARQSGAADRGLEAALRRAGDRLSERRQHRGAALSRPGAGAVCCESIEGAAAGGR